MNRVEAERLLGWVYQRSRVALFSKKASERDKALADINAHTAHYAGRWQPDDKNRDPNSTWCGESP